MKYNVHIYAVVRIKYVNVEAGTMEDAIKNALDMADLERDWRTASPDYAEFADDVTGYLVDEVGDDEFEHTVAFDQNMIPYKPEEVSGHKR